MTRRPTRAVTAALLIPLALASCGGGETQEKAAPSSTTSKAAPTSSAPKASPVSKPSSPSSAAGKGLMDPSPKGAVYLARTYFALVNKNGHKPQPGTLDQLALPSCKSCDGYEGEVRSLSSKKQRYSGDIFTITSTKPLRVNGFVEVHTGLRQNPIKVTESSGSVVDSVQAATDTAVLFARWTQRGWRVHKIQSAG